MIGYEASKSRETYTIEEPDARRAFAPVHTFLDRCTDCQGPWEANGVPSDRYEALRNPRWAASPKPSTLGALRELVDELVRDSRPCSLDLRFDFMLRDQPYGEPQLDARGVDTRMSWLTLHLRHGRDSDCAFHLWWPVEEPTAAWVQSHDAIFGALELQPRPSGWRRGDPSSSVAFDLDRGAFEPPPADEVGASLHALVLENPSDTEARLAYGDWLSSRGDPLGEMLVVQVHLATATDRRKKSALRGRARELLAAHGLRWSRVLVPR